MKHNYLNAFFLIAAFLLNFNLLWADTKLFELPKAADISVNDIYIRDPESSTSVLGHNINLIESEVEFPHINVLNRNKIEVLVLIFHYGDFRYSFSEFKVLPVSPDFNEEAFHFKNIESFKTGKNISLGLTKEIVVSILGQGYQENVYGDGEILEYTIDNFKSSPFLKYYNMPSYYGEYFFENNKLVKFYFGFKYP
jgi:hypothetical protein